MKQKKISKKLTLNKTTVAVLNSNEEKKVKGGYCYPSGVVKKSCPPDDPTV